MLIGRALPAARVIALFGARPGGPGVWGPLVFGMFYVVATLLFVPVVVPTLGAGVLFGVWVGTLVASLASTASAALTFLAARYLARAKVRRWVRAQPRLRAVDKALEHGGWRIVALLRLSALLPFSLQNYLHGLTPIGFWPYLLSTWLAMLPGIFLCTYVGRATGDAVSNTHDRIAAEWVALGVGLAATVAVSVYITSLTKKYLRQYLLKKQKEVTSGGEDGTPPGPPSPCGGDRRRVRHPIQGTPELTRRAAQD
ncbi:MAG TPA: TVP38/TMEM64 family protein [Candidatus Binatia bacterium]|nr:TVP38/TMEM64 family protein [Candidatus Binatia bacterium]